MAAGDRGRDGVGAGLDAVGDQLVARAVQRVDALHQHPMRAGAFDPRAHGVQAQREVADLRIARRVEDLGFAARQRRRHQRRLGRADRWRGQHDAAAAQAVRLCARRCSRLRCRPSAPSASSALRCRSTGRAPIAQPPGSDTRAEPKRASSGPSTRMLARMRRTMS